MSLGRRLINTGGVAACTTDSADVFGDSSGIALYNLDYDASEASGSYDGTPTNVDFGVGGQINYGARFNGSSSYIDISNFPNSIFKDSTNGYTVSFWFKRESGTSSSLQAFFGTALQTKALNVYFRQSDNLFQIENGSASAIDITGGFTYDDGNWHHFVLTDTKVYIDGSETMTYTGNYPSTFTDGQTFHIGSRHSASRLYYGGDIDQVRIFDKALTSDEVSTLYAETACVYTATTTDNDYPTTNLAYYKLDNSAEDEKGSYDGTETNVEYRFGRFGQAAVFNGSSSIITATQPSGLNGPCTYSAWLKTTSNSYQSIITVGSVTGSHTAGVNLFVNSGKLSCQTGNGSSTENSTVNSTSDIDTGNWVHCAVVVAGSTQGSSIKVYVNGQEEGSGTADNTAIVAASSESLCLGGRILSGSQSTFLNGSLDQVRIFSTALSSSQVTELYNEKPEVDTSNFKTVLYEGTGSTQYISNVGFEPDLVWLKSRSYANNHFLFDSVRGANKAIYIQAEAEITRSGVTSFDSNGFTLGTSGDMNTSSATYVAWNWKGGGDAVTGTGTGVTNVSISANTDAGFSIVKYTGSGAAGMSFGHGLTEAIPELVIIKNLDNPISWQIFGGSLFTRMQLNEQGGDDGNLGLTITSTTIQTTQTSGQEGNSAWNATDDYIAYIWHSVSEYSKIGTYEGNGGTDVTVSDVGFKPSWILVKNVDASASWVIFDNRRNTIEDRLNNQLFPDTSAQESGASATVYITVNSSGFVVNGASNSKTSASGQTYLYMAFK